MRPVLRSPSLSVMPEGRGGGDTKTGHTPCHSAREISRKRRQRDVSRHPAAECSARFCWMPLTPRLIRVYGVSLLDRESFKPNIVMNSSNSLRVNLGADEWRSRIKSAFSCQVSVTTISCVLKGNLPELHEWWLALELFFRTGLSKLTCCIVS